MERTPPAYHYGGEFHDWNTGAILAGYEGRAKCLDGHDKIIMYTWLDRDTSERAWGPDPDTAWRQGR